MFNQFQFLHKYLTATSAVRLFCLYKSDDMKELTKKRLGYVPVDLSGMISHGEQSLSIGSDLTVHYDGENLHVYSAKEAVHFKIIQKEDMIELCTYVTELHNVQNFRRMMTCVKKSFEEFYTDKCCITHCQDLQVVMKLSCGVVVIPPYINCTIIEGRDYLTVP